MDVLVAVVDLNQAAWGQRAAAAAAASSASAAADGTASSGIGDAAAAAGNGVAAVAAPSVLTASAFIDQLIVFFNAFMVLNKANQLCVIGVDGTRADYVWPLSMVHQHAAAAADSAMDTSEASTAAKSKRKGSQAAASAAAASFAGASTAAVAAPASSTDAAVATGVSDELLRQLHAFANSTTLSDVPPAEAGSKLAGALSLGLCYLNRVQNLAAANPSGVKLRSRVLMLSACSDQSSQYVAMMNGIFAAQKLRVPIDACVLSERDSLFLQQAAHLSKGVYARVPLAQQPSGGLLQFLLFIFLSDATSRAHLVLPTQTQVDLRATCFCHQQVVELAVICPVCLSIFCKSQPKCAVCNTRFALLSTAAPAAGAHARAQSAAISTPAAPAGSPVR